MGIWKEKGQAGEGKEGSYAGAEGLIVPSKPGARAMQAANGGHGRNRGRLG